VRHGETLWNQDGRFQGQTDVPLSEAGRRQAQALRRVLAKELVQAAYSSDLCRAWETAQTCLQGRDVVIAAEPRLRERCYGEWEGKTRQEVELLTAGASSPPATGDAEVVLRGGESWPQVQERVTVALREILSRHGGQTVVIVGHGGSLRALLIDQLGLPAETRRHLRTDNAGISEIQTGPEGGYLVRWNDTHHLTAEPV
jgi:broad specificity phosphatase PhoE